MTLINLICPNCETSFIRPLNYVNQSNKRNRKMFCSSQCRNLFFRVLPIDRTCLNCKTLLHTSEQKKFCSTTCAAIYNNAHKTKGTRVSKLELYLQRELIKLYLFEIKYNSKEEINSELDIYIPSLKLAFELNGIFHYEPIFGKEKLSQIQNNDSRKFQACLEHKIELCTIDVSAQKYFKEQTAKKYLNIVVNIINKKISSSEDVQDIPREGTS